MAFVLCCFLGEPQNLLTPFSLPVPSLVTGSLPVIYFSIILLPNSSSFCSVYHRRIVFHTVCVHIYIFFPCTYHSCHACLVISYSYIFLVLENFNISYLLIQRKKIMHFIETVVRIFSLPPPSFIVFYFFFFFWQ